MLFVVSTSRQMGRMVHRVRWCDAWREVSLDGPPAQ
jgi:hypothetical protein